MTHASFSIPVLTVETAPAGARDTLMQVQAQFGFVPNLTGVLANAPALLGGYLALAAIFEKSSFSPTERLVVLFTVSYENRCEYCVAAHSTIAGMQGIDAGVVRALRARLPLADAKLEALRAFTAGVVGTRGWPPSDAVGRFTKHGYTSEHALEVVLGVGLKTLSNYANHLADTPLDRQFAAGRIELVPQARDLNEGEHK